MNYQEFMNENNITMLVSAKISENELEIFKQGENLESYDLLIQLFLNVKNVSQINEMLEEQLMPRMWKQDHTKCTICKPLNNIIIGLFYNEFREIKESYKYALELNKKIKGLNYFE